MYEGQCDPTKPPGPGYENISGQWLCTDKAKAQQFFDENRGKLAIWQMNNQHLRN